MGGKRYFYTHNKDKRAQWPSRSNKGAKKQASQAILTGKKKRRCKEGEVKGTAVPSWSREHSAAAVLSQGKAN